MSSADPPIPSASISTVPSMIDVIAGLPEGDWRVAAAKALVKQREITSANDRLLQQAGLALLQTGKYVPPTPESYSDDPSPSPAN